MSPKSWQVRPSSRNYWILWIKTTDNNCKTWAVDKVCSPSLAFRWSRYGNEWQSNWVALIHRVKYTFWAIQLEGMYVVFRSPDGRCAAVKTPDHWIHTWVKFLLPVWTDGREYEVRRRQPETYRWPGDRDKFVWNEPRNKQLQLGANLRFPRPLAIITN